MDEVPMIDDFVVVDVRIPMMPTTPEIPTVDVYMDWTILILDETPSFDNQLPICNLHKHPSHQSTASPLMSGANINKKITEKRYLQDCRSGWNVVDESAQSPLETSITSHVNFESLTIDQIGV